MADIHTFRSKRTSPQAPERFTTDQRDEWERMVSRLRHVGMLSRTNPRALARYVKRSTRLDALHQRSLELRKSIEQLRGLTTQVRGAVRMWIIDAMVQLTDCWASLVDEQRKLALTLLA